MSGYTSIAAVHSLPTSSRDSISNIGSPEPEQLGSFVAERPSHKLVVILHADVVGSTALVQHDETVAHERIQDSFRRFSETIGAYGGVTHEIRGDALVAEFDRASDAVCAGIAFQADNSQVNAALEDDVRPEVRIGISMGEVVIADNTITGAGVVLAQRLEQLADPGGMCIQDAAYLSVPKRLPFDYKKLGERRVMGFDEPVRVYAVSLQPGGVIPEFETLVQPQAAALDLPEKPSIAVLPFTNMSGDPEQEYFSDGITEDIVTELSRFSELFVIARNSAAVFKGKQTNTKEIAKMLGVQYVVEGSVRKAANRIRITAQLIDAPVGGHVWADRYDRELEDIFQVQDEVVQAIVAVLPGRIANSGAELSRRKPPANLSAYDYLLRGNHALPRRVESSSKAIAMYRKAIDLDPQCAAAYAGIAVAEGFKIWEGTRYDEDPFTRAFENAREAVAIDDNDYRSHGVMGLIYCYGGEHALARRHLERAMSLNPNSAETIGFWAMVLAYSGEHEAAIEAYKRALRLDPFGQEAVYPEALAESYYMTKRYQEAIAVLKTMLDLPIHYAHQQIAMCYAQLGDMAASERYRKIYYDRIPENYDEIKFFESHMRMFLHQEDRDHWLDGYRKVGLDI